MCVYFNMLNIMTYEKSIDYLLHALGSNKMEDREINSTVSSFIILGELF